MPKVVIIGAGSLVFSSRLQADILSFENLRDTHFSLVDIDEERLVYAQRITERLLKSGAYSEASFEATTDQRQALVGADYVISCLLVGGYKAIEAEIDIPQKYGVDQCIGDTLTPGGIMRCLRTLPTQIGIAQDIMELCPKALLLNYTNPMSMLCWGMYRAAPGIQLVGLCHSVQGTSEQWAKRLDVELKDVDWSCAGINHQAWFYKFEKDGQDLLPRIRELATDPRIWAGDSVRMEMVKHFGYPVTESSGHGSEYTPWWRKHPELVEQYCPGGGWNGGSGFIKELYARPDWKADMEKMATGEKEISLERSHEYGSRIIHAAEGGQTAVIHGNVENLGLIDNLPNGSCVEVPVYVDRKGLQPIKVGEIPMANAAINQTQINVQRLTVEASLTRDPERLFQAFAMDPLTAACLTLDEIRAMASEILEAQRFCLPEWEGIRIPEKPVLAGVATDNVERHVDSAEKNIDGS